MNVSRRGFLRGLVGGAAVVAFPSIVRAESLMKILAPTQVWIPDLRLITPQRIAEELISVQPMDDALVGYRGRTVFDVGFYYCPYVPLLARPS